VNYSFDLVFTNVRYNGVGGEMTGEIVFLDYYRILICSSFDNYGISSVRSALILTHSRIPFHISSSLVVHSSKGST
jgi:hypothetical protein